MGSATKIAGHTLGPSGAALTFGDAYATQHAEDAARADLTDTEKTVRAGISGFLTITTSVGLGLGLGVLCSSLGLLANRMCCRGAYGGAAAGANAAKFVNTEFEGAVEGVAGAIDTATNTIGNLWNDLWK